MFISGCDTLKQKVLFAAHCADDTVSSSLGTMRISDYLNREIMSRVFGFCFMQIYGLKAPVLDSTEGILSLNAAICVYKQFHPLLYYTCKCTVVEKNSAKLLCSWHDEKQQQELQIYQAIGIGVRN